MSIAPATVEQDMLKRELPKAVTAEFSADAPPVFLGYQQRWVEDDSQLKIGEKSRRIGLTWAEAADDVLIAASQLAAGGQNVYYIGYNMDMAIEYIEACAMWARVLSAAASSVEEGIEVFDAGNDDRAIKTYTIRFASGFRIVALSSRPANLRGKQGVVVIDEAAFHGALDELLKAALALLIWGGKVRIISTHDGDQNPFNELVNEVRSLRRKGSVHRIEFKEAVEEGLYRRVCLRRGIEWTAEGEAAWVAEVYAFYGDAANEELDVIPSQGSGSWLSSALIEARMAEAPVLRFTAPRGFEQQSDAARHEAVQDWLDEQVKTALDLLDPTLQSVFGWDFGRSGDLSVMAPAQITQQLKRRMPFAIELRNVPHKQQQQILFYVTERLPNFVKGAMDARGNGHALAEFAAQKFGWSRVELVMFSEAWYREHMPPYKAAFEDGTVELPRDKDWLADHRAIKMVRGIARVPDGKTTGADGGKRHGDAGIAGALMHYASRHPGSVIEFQGVPTGQRGFGDAANHADDDSAVEARTAW